MKPISISEKMMFNTIRIVASDGSCGTGSFFIFSIKKQKIPVIITNQHVVRWNSEEQVSIFVHIKGENGDSIENLNVTYKTHWIFHEKYDLCFCYALPLIKLINEKFNKDIFYFSNDESLIYSSDELEELSAIEELVMVGYPNGLWDEKNNFPIFRRGFTANHPAIDFNRKNIGVVDMACFPGSSGSPIYILNENGYSDKKHNTYLGSGRVILLGFLFQGPQMDLNGEIKIEDIPTSFQKLISNSKIMINLGYYIKAKVLLDFKKIIEQTILQE